MEKHYVFIKNNIVENIAVFASENKELANRIVSENGYDDAIWIDDKEKPAVFGTYNPDTGEFAEPTLDYLYERGIAQENTAMMEARLAAEVATQKVTPIPAIEN